MHICQECRWEGELPINFPSEKDQIQTLLSLRPGETVPSGRCPACNGLTTPNQLAAIHVPEGIEKNADEPFTGWRWMLHVDQTRSSVAVYLQDRLTGAANEIAIDSSGERVRLEITAFKKQDAQDATGVLFDPETEPQLMLSLGNGHVASFPCKEADALPVIFDDNGFRSGRVMTINEFASIESSSDRGFGSA